jgi:hypothetical protein
MVRRFPVRGALREETEAQWPVPSELQRCQWRDVITEQVHASGEVLSATSLWGTWPVAVLYASLTDHSRLYEKRSDAVAVAMSR